MVRSVAAAVLISIALAVDVAAQTTKVDSLLVVLKRPKALVMDQVLSGFAQAGLEVTDNSGSLVTSDQGGRRSAWTGIRSTRVVRALVLARDSMVTQVLITGMEMRQGAAGLVHSQTRVDNRADGAGGQLWCKMVHVAMSLDPGQVSPDARASRACPGGK
jgi:hypothetical protein